MGLGNVFLNDLIELKQKGALDGATRVMEIGAQQISDSLMIAPGLPEAYRLFGCTSPPVLTPVGTENFTKSAPFWSALGFARSAIDVEGDAIRIDLNRGKVPRRLRCAFDLVVNAGTTEHVVNQDNAFRVMHDLTKVGGVMMHEVPAGGMLTHGVVSYNAQFFWLLCRDNSYEVIDLTVSHAGDAPISSDVVASNAKYARSLNPIQTRLIVPIFLVTAILQKNSRKTFVTPLDVPAEALRR